jgi:hypothetical protein
LVLDVTDEQGGDNTETGTGSGGQGSGRGGRSGASMGSNRYAQQERLATLSWNFAAGLFYDLLNFIHGRCTAMRSLWGVRRVCTVLSHHQHSRVGAIAISDWRFHTMEGHSGRCELDLHADTCVAGANFAICEFDGMSCEVSPYTDSYEAMKDVPIVGAATAWTNVEMGETHILYFNQMLWYGGKMPMSLLNPN